MVSSGRKPAASPPKPKAKRQVRFQIPRINRDGDIDYAPEVDPYEDMDVEGLLNLEDYVAPGAEKQIAKASDLRTGPKMPKEAPKYEMDPSFWQIPSEPGPPGPPEEPLQIEGLEEPEGKIQVIYNFPKRKKK